MLLLLLPGLVSVSGSTRDWAEGKAEMARVISSMMGLARVEEGKKRLSAARQSSARLRANSSVVLMLSGIDDVWEARERKRMRRVAWYAQMAVSNSRRRGCVLWWLRLLRI